MDDRLVQLRRRVDDHFTAARGRSPDAFACRRGCDTCCHRRFSVFAIEAERIRLALAKLEPLAPGRRARVRRQADTPEHADRCALLVDGECSVYDERPLICRSHGLPINVATRADPDVDWCPLNFTRTAPPASSVLQLDALNEPLSVMATLFDGRGERVALTDLARGD